MGKVKNFGSDAAKQTAASGESGVTIAGDTPSQRLLSWTALAKAHVHKAGGTWSIVRQLDGPSGSIATGRPHTLAQWLAWMDYFDRMGVPHTFLDYYGVATMPAAWPHLFDTAETARQAHWNGRAEAALAHHDRELAERIAFQKGPKFKTMVGRFRSAVQPGQAAR